MSLSSVFEGAHSVRASISNSLLDYSSSRKSHGHVGIDDLCAMAKLCINVIEAALLSMAQNWFGFISAAGVTQNSSEWMTFLSGIGRTLYKPVLLANCWLAPQNKKMCQKPGRSGLDHELISQIMECSSALQQIHCWGCSERDAGVPLLQLLPASLLPSIWSRDQLNTGSGSDSVSGCNGKILLFWESMSGFFVWSPYSPVTSPADFDATKAPAGTGGRGRKEKAEQDYSVHQ